MFYHSWKPAGSCHTRLLHAGEKSDPGKRTPARSFTARHHQEPQGARTRPRTSILVTLEKRVSPGAHATGSGRSQSTTQPRTRFQSRDVIPQLPRPSAPPAPPDRWCVSRSDEEDGFSSGCSNRTLFFLVLLCAPRGPHLPSLLATESRIPACAEVRAFNCHCIRRCGA